MSGSCSRILTASIKNPGVGLRYRRSEGRKGAAGPAGVRQPANANARRARIAMITLSKLSKSYCILQARSKLVQSGQFPPRPRVMMVYGRADLPLAELARTVGEGSRRPGADAVGIVVDCRGV